MVGLAETGSFSGRHGIQARLDAEYAMSNSFLDKLQLGIRFSDNDAFSYDYTQNNTAPPKTLYTLLPLDYGTITPGFRNDDTDSLRVFLAPTRKSLVENIDYLRDLTGLSTPQFGDPTYRSNEKDYAGYIQARYAFDVGFPIDGMIGLRAVRTEDVIHGSDRETLPDPDGGDDPIVNTTPITRTNSYTDFLPNISARLHLARDFQIRLAVTKTRTRPNFGQLNPTLTINLPPAACIEDPALPGNGPDSPDCVRTADSGNSDLNPIKSTNYDASFEYYPSRSTSLTLGLFRRDVKGFISDFTVEVDDPEYGRLRITRPDNGGRGKIQGVEAAFTTLLDSSWLPSWLHNFGVQANYTYLDHSSELPEAYAASLPGQQPIAGVSSHIYNLVGFYETKGLSVRVAYNHRSKFVVNYQQLNDPGVNGLGPVLPLIEDGRGTLDLAATIHPTENLAFSFNVSNILGAAETNHRQFNEQGDVYPFQTSFLETVYRVGLRFSF
jgi:TonB-dependent receptor